jgi:hypothetical protein
MPADAPNILATSGGIQEGRRTRREYSALSDYAIELSGVTGREQQVCCIAAQILSKPSTNMTAP